MAKVLSVEALKKHLAGRGVPAMIGVKPIMVCQPAPGGSGSAPGGGGSGSAPGGGGGASGPVLRPRSDRLTASAATPLAASPSAAVPKPPAPAGATPAAATPHVTVRSSQHPPLSLSAAERTTAQQQFTVNTPVWFWQNVAAGRRRPSAHVSQAIGDDGYVGVLVRNQGKAGYIGLTL